LNRRELWLILPVLSVFILFLLSICGISTSSSYLYRGIRLLVFLLTPGYYVALMVGNIIELKLDEMLVLTILISIAIDTLLSVYLTFVLSNITESLICVGLLIVTMSLCMISVPRLLELHRQRGEFNYLSISKAIIGLVFSFLIGFILVRRFITTTYWRGWDPWGNAPTARVIIERGLTPLELKKWHYGYANIGISGFFYFLASINVFTGSSFYQITRFGGPVLAGFASMITYLIVKKLEGFGAGILASFFLFLNSFFVNRFSMTLRENFSYIFFLMILFLLIVKNKYHGNKRLSIFYPLSISFLYVTILISHLLTSIIISSILLIEIMFSIFKDKKNMILELVQSLSISILLAFPYLGIIASSLDWVKQELILSEIRIIILIMFLIPIIIIILIISYKKLRKLYFNNYYKKLMFIIISIILIVGALNTILYPKTFKIFEPYNPPITINMFAISILPLALIGFISSIWFSIPKVILSFSYILVLILNLINLDIAFPLFRLVIYVSWILSYSSVMFLKFIYEFNVRTNIKLIINLERFKKKNIIIKLKSSIIIVIAILIILSPMIISDFNASKPEYLVPNFTQDDVDSAIEFLSLLKENDVVIPQERTLRLLRYVGIDLSIVINDKELHLTNDPQRFYQIIISRHSNASRVLVFTIQRCLGNELFPTPSLEMLELLGVKNQIGSIIFYTISFNSG